MVDSVLAQAILNQRAPDIVGAFQQGRERRRLSDVRRLSGEVLQGQEGSFEELQGIDPAVALQLRETLRSRDNETLNDTIADSRMAAALLGSGNIEGTRNLLTQRIQAQQLVGEDSTDSMRFLQGLDTDPQAVFNELNSFISGIDQLKQQGSALKSFAPVQIVNPESGEVRLASPTVDPRTGRATLSQFDLPEGFEVAKETPEQKRQAEILAEQQKQRGKREVELELDAPIALAALETGTSNLQRLRNEALAIRNDPALERVTGVMGAFKSIPGSAAADVEARIDTLSSQIAFNTLQAMREASKTGGALGQVSERELDLLINNLATLRQSQSPEAFRRNLDQIIEFTEGAEGRLNKTFDRTFGKFVDRDVPSQSADQAQRLVFDPATQQLVPK